MFFWNLADLGLFSLHEKSFICIEIIFSGWNLSKFCHSLNFYIGSKVPYLDFLGCQPNHVLFCGAFCILAIEKKWNENTLFLIPLIFWGKLPFLTNKWFFVFHIWIYFLMLGQLMPTFGPLLFLALNSKNLLPSIVPWCRCEKI